MVQDTLNSNGKDSLGLAQDSLHAVAVTPAPAKAVKPAPKPPRKIVYTTSLFKGHELQKIHTDGLIRDTAREEWLIGLLVIILAVIAYLRVSYYKRFTQLISASFDFQLSNQMVREESVLTQRVSLFLTGIFWVALPLFLLQAIRYFHIPLYNAGPYSGLLVFLTLLGLVALIYGLKVFSIRLLGSIFKVEKETEAYIFNVFLYNKLSGLLLLPMVILIRFMPEDFVEVFFIAGLAVLGIAFIARMARGILIGLSKKGVSMVHLVLYFCTLEILPIVLGIKFLSEQLV